MIATSQSKASIQIVDLIVTDEDRKFEPAGRMAAAIIQITQEQGGCLPQDLNAKGFTPKEVSNYWHMAHSLAAVEINLMGDTAPTFRRK